MRSWVGWVALGVGCIVTVAAVLVGLGVLESKHGPVGGFVYLASLASVNLGLALYWLDREHYA